MGPAQPTIAAMIDEARFILTQLKFDTEAVLMILATLPVNDLDAQTQGAVHHARVLVSAVKDNSNDNHTTHRAVARFALARVIVLLDRHVAVSLHRASSGW